MAEWSKAAASKAVISGKPGSRVRIPLSPPYFANASYGTAIFLNEIDIIFYRNFND